MITIDGMVLNVDEDLVKRHKKLTGDTDELFTEVVKIMVKGETGLEFGEAVLQVPPEKLARVIEERLESELSGFWGA